MSGTQEHGYTMVSCVGGVWYTRIEYDNGRIVEFYTAECIASDGRF